MNGHGMSATEVAARAGITYRQLDYWIRKGWVDGTNPGHGYRRKFTEEDAARVAMMGRLTEAGMDPERAAALCGLLTSDGRVYLAPGLLVVDERRSAP